jgi:hypothetical protein
MNLSNIFAESFSPILSNSEISADLRFRTQRSASTTYRQILQFRHLAKNGSAALPRVLSQANREAGASHDTIAPDIPRAAARKTIERGRCE